MVCLVNSLQHKHFLVEQANSSVTLSCYSRPMTWESHLFIQSVSS